MDRADIILINGSPRKNGNTAQMCASFAEGAESAGATTQTVHLYDITFTGCRSCFACKLKRGKHFGACGFRDGITPILESVFQARGLVLASPIYFGDLTAGMRAFMERLLFPILQYDADLSTVIKRRLRTALIYTMNVSQDYFYNQYLGRPDSDTLATFERNIAHLVAEPADVLPERLYAFDTYQFADYSKYVAPCFDEAHKARHRDEQFPKDLQAAFEAGTRMAQSLN